MYFYCYAYIFLLYVYVSSSCQLALLGYPDWGFSVLFPQLQGKCQGKIHKDRARPAVFHNFCVVLNFLLFNALFVLCRSVYCLCVNVYCTTATGWLPTAINKYIINHISEICQFLCWLENVRFCCEVGNTFFIYRGANKSLAGPRRKQAIVSVRMVWISFGALPCRKKKLDDSSRLDVVENARFPDMLLSLFHAWSG